MELNEIKIESVSSIIYCVGGEIGKMYDYSRKLEHNELIFSLGGECRVEFDDKIFDEKENCIRFLPAGKGEKYRVVRSVSGACIDIFFDSDIQLSQEAFCKVAARADKIRALFVRAENVWRKKRKGYRYAAIACLYEILSQLDFGTYCGDKTDRITPGAEYIENNFLDEIDFSKCGELCGMSYTYFKKLFSARYGMAPKAYAISLRIKHAEDLLSSGMYSVGETARLCGYENEYYFSRDFKTRTGVAPSAFAKNN